MKVLVEYMLCWMCYRGGNIKYFFVWDDLKAWRSLKLRSGGRFAEPDHPHLLIINYLIKMNLLISASAQLFNQNEPFNINMKCHLKWICLYHCCAMWVYWDGYLWGGSLGCLQGTRWQLKATLGQQQAGFWRARRSFRQNHLGWAQLPRNSVPAG